REAARGVRCVVSAGSQMRAVWYARGWDDLVHPPPQRGRDCDVESCRGLEIDHQFELCRLLDRQVAWLRALQNLVDVHSGTAKEIGKARPIRQEPTLPGMPRVA